jgi:hypothetical protein
MYFRKQHSIAYRLVINITGQIKMFLRVKMVIISNEEIPLCFKVRKDFGRGELLRLPRKLIVMLFFVYLHFIALIEIAYCLLSIITQYFWFKANEVCWWRLSRCFFSLCCLKLIKVLMIFCKSGWKWSISATFRDSDVSLLNVIDTCPDACFFDTR